MNWKNYQTYPLETVEDFEDYLDFLHKEEVGNELEELQIKGQDFNDDVRSKIDKFVTKFTIKGDWRNVISHGWGIGAVWGDFVALTVDGWCKAARAALEVSYAQWLKQHEDGTETPDSDDDDCIAPFGS